MMITHLKLNSYGMQSFQMIGNIITVVYLFDTNDEDVKRTKGQSSAG